MNLSRPLLTTTLVAGSMLKSVGFQALKFFKYVGRLSTVAVAAADLGKSNDAFTIKNEG